MSTDKKKDGALLKGNRLPARGPIGEGRDPLTLGETTYGEDVKGSSVNEAPAQETKPAANK